MIIDMDIIEQHWEEIKDGIRKEYEITKIAYNIWIAPLKYYQCIDHTVTIQIPNDLSQMLGYIEKQYKLFFKVFISEFTNDEYDVEFILESGNHENRDLNDDNKKYNKKEIDLKEKESNLHPKYRFENFVTGTNNNMAQAACLAVAESPGKDFNPLFIYGGPGLGKTHLMHSIGHYIIENNKDMKVLYVTADDFTNEVVESIRRGKSNSNISSMSEFREKYRNIDVLLIDDIQNIIGKIATQEQFFHTFNALHSAGKAIVISSDRHPKEMTELDERFRSRFEWGLTVDIQPPSYETRVAILMKFAETSNKELPYEVIEYIAYNIKSNVRELEGAFNKVFALKKVMPDKPVDLEFAKEALKDTIFPDKPKIITLNMILEVVADHYKIDQEEITSKKRTQEIAFPRQIFMYLCREMMPDTTLKGIAAILGRDHSTVLHGIKKVEEDINNNKDLRDTIDILKEKIKSV